MIQPKWFDKRIAVYVNGVIGFHDRSYRFT